MDKQKALRIEEIFLPSNQVQNDYFCENFIIFPDGKEKFGGHVLGIIEINATPTEHGQKISNTIISSLKDHYYRQIVTSPDPQKLNLETVFEHALQKTNEKVLQLIQNGQIQLILENVNFLVAVVKPGEIESDIIFSHRGSIQSFLIHKTKKSNYKIIDILAGSESSSENKVKIFASIISGKIFLPDALIISNEGFARFFSAEKINQIASNRPVKEIIEDFKILLQKRPQGYAKTYSAIFIKQEDLQLIEQEEASQESINTLVSTQIDTEKFLTPAIGINIKQKFKNIGKKFLSIFSRQKKPKGIAVDEIRSSPSLIKSILNKLGISKGKKVAAESKSEKKEKPMAPKTKKIIIILIIVLVVVFALSIVWIYKNQETKKDDAAYNSSIKSIETKLNQAEAAFLFRNTEKSLNLMAEAKNLISKLPKESEEEKQNITKLENLYKALNNKLLKLESVQAQDIITLANLNTDSPKLQILDNQTLIVSDQNNLNAIDLSSAQVSSTVETNIGVNVLSNFAVDNQTMYILFENNNVYQYSTDNDQFEKVSLDSEGSWTNLYIYNTHLYFLSPTDNQIYKLRNVGSNSYGPPASWVNEAADFSSATSMAIDGDIYVLSSNGAIQKFLSGDKQSFSAQNIEPKIESASKIYTNVDSSYIYVLDKNTNRVIVYGKNGLVVIQYQIENAQSLSDMTVDEKNRKIYLIDGQKIIAISLKHL